MIISDSAWSLRRTIDDASVESLRYEKETPLDDKLVEDRLVDSNKSIIRQPRRTESPGNTCCKTAKCADYNGTIAVTKDGETCKDWVLGINYKPWDYPNGRLIKNYCRNPESGKDKTAWCYTLGGLSTSWDWCDIPQCKDAEVDKDCQEVSNSFVGEEIEGAGSSFDAAGDWHLTPRQDRGITECIELCLNHPDAKGWSLRWFDNQNCHCFRTITDSKRNPSFKSGKFCQCDLKYHPNILRSNNFSLPAYCQLPDGDDVAPTSPLPNGASCNLMCTGSYVGTPGALECRARDWKIAGNRVKMAPNPICRDAGDGAGDDAGDSAGDDAGDGAGAGASSGAGAGSGDGAGAGAGASAPNMLLLGIALSFTARFITL